jgi:hypothetical protein
MKTAFKGEQSSLLTSFSLERKHWIKESLRLIGLEFERQRKDIQLKSWWLMGSTKSWRAIPLRES